MADKKNVMIFPSPTYPAMQMIDCLKNNPLYHVIAAASYPNHAEFVCDDTIDDMPFISDPGFVEKLARTVRDRDISFIFPTDDTIAMVLKEHEAELGAKVVCSPLETTVLCRYKKRMFEALRGEDFMPKVYEADAIDRISEYPVFVKPDVSQGSRGAMRVDTPEALRAVGHLEDMVICEYLPGEEYTVDCFTDREGRLTFMNPRVRTRLIHGITARGHNVPRTAEFEHVLNGLNSAVRFRGYWFAQLKRDRSGKLKLLEICTRFSGSFAISKGKGVNLPLLALCDFDDRPANVVENDCTVECDKTYIDRYRLSIRYDRVYVDYDDTVTSMKGQGVNPYVMAFLYQCRNRGVRISLVTRHFDTFGETLDASFERLGLSRGLFDEVIELSWDQEKCDLMKDAQSAIFLDNSFAERRKVHDRLHMPVFDITNIDCLFDWRQ